MSDKHKQDELKARGYNIKRISKDLTIVEIPDGQKARKEDELSKKFDRVSFRIISFFAIALSGYLFFQLMPWGVALGGVLLQIMALAVAIKVFKL